MNLSLKNEFLKATKEGFQTSLVRPEANKAMTNRNLKTIALHYFLQYVQNVPNTYLLYSLVSQAIEYKGKISCWPLNVIILFVKIVVKPWYIVNGVSENLKKLNVLHFGQNAEQVFILYIENIFLYVTNYEN